MIATPPAARAGRVPSTDPYTHTHVSNPPRQRAERPATSAPRRGVGGTPPAYMYCTPSERRAFWRPKPTSARHRSQPRTTPCRPRAARRAWIQYGPYRHQHGLEPSWGVDAEADAPGRGCRRGLLVTCDGHLPAVGNAPPRPTLALCDAPYKANMPSVPVSSRTLREHYVTRCPPPARTFPGDGRVAGGV